MPLGRHLGGMPERDASHSCCANNAACCTDRCHGSWRCMLLVVTTRRRPPCEGGLENKAEVGKGHTSPARGARGGANAPATRPLGRSAPRTPSREQTPPLTSLHGGMSSHRWPWHTGWTRVAMPTHGFCRP